LHSRARLAAAAATVKPVVAQLTTRSATVAAAATKTATPVAVAAAVSLQQVETLLRLPGRAVQVVTVLTSHHSSRALPLIVPPVAVAQVVRLLVRQATAELQA